MTRETFQFEFEQSVPLAEAEMTLQLSLFAAAGLYGSAVVKLDGAYRVDQSRHTIFIYGGGDVGETIAKIFTELAQREFGEGSFRARRIEGKPDRVDPKEPIPQHAVTTAA